MKTMMVQEPSKSVPVSEDLYWQMCIVPISEVARKRDSFCRLAAMYMDRGWFAGVKTWWKLATEAEEVLLGFEDFAI